MKTELIGYLADPIEVMKAERKIQRENFKYFLKQRLMGVLTVIVGIAAIRITPEGITATMFLIPFGLAMLCSTEKMIT